MTPTGVTVLGATGSIGRNTLSVLALHPERYHVVALTAHSRVDDMLSLCLLHRPLLAVMSEPVAGEKLRNLLREHGSETEVLLGPDALLTAAAHVDAQVVMAAIVGAAGLLPALAAVRAGKRVLLANKEALVMSGELFMAEVRQHGATLIPIDSEHNAIFQCLPPGYWPGQQQVLADKGVRRLLLTASGGPFRQWTREQMQAATPAQAVRHPNWTMGAKISVDSASLMNKGLELIEACFLFGMKAEQIEVVVHPQSVIHSLVEYVDGSVLAQLGSPDMRTPIACGLAWPERMPAGVQALDLFQVAHLDFEAPDLQRFPALTLAREAARCGGTAPAILNAANEVAVSAFLSGQIGFTRISEIVAQTLSQVVSGAAPDIDTVLQADAVARRHATALLEC